jgi:MinD superfamily P-loop ATPase
MILSIASGKGGTGKTLIAANIAISVGGNIQLLDCDVEEPNLHMLLHPEVIEKQESRGSMIARIDDTKCRRCGLCREKCRFDAISEDFKVDPFSCEGCGVCTLVCPVNAISLDERIAGYVYLSKIKSGFMVHAMLNPGEANSGKLVAIVRQNAVMLAERENIDIILIDGPPGIGCPAISSVVDVDIGLIITEPTISGFHDLKRVLLLLKHFDIPSLVCINMYDINYNNTDKIVEFCRENDIEVIGRIPFNPEVTKAMIDGKTIVEYSPESDAAKEIERIWGRILSIIGLL